MHDPENKAESWESPLEASPSPVLLSIVRLPGWMPPTPGMSEVEAVPPPPEERSPGTLTLLQRAKLLRLREKKVKIASGCKHCPLWAPRHTKLIKKKEQKQHGELTIRRLQSWQAKGWVQLSNFTVIQIVGQLNTRAKKKRKTLSYVCCSYKHCVCLHQELLHILTKTLRKSNKNKKIVLIWTTPAVLRSSELLL